MIIFIANQFIGEKVSTGGDVLAREIARRIKGDLAILAPSQIHSELERSLGHGKYINTDSFRIKSETASNLLGGALTLLHYLIRSWTTIIWLIKNVKAGDTVYLTGDFICNAFPGLVIKKINRQVKVLANFFHRNPLPAARPGNNYVVSYFSGLLQGISLKIIKQIALKIFVLSEVGKEELMKEGFSSSQIVISGAGINIVKPKRNTVKRKNQIVFIGRMNVTKGAFDLIEIFHQVDKENSDLNLVMIGGTSEADLDKLNRLIRLFRLEGKVNYLGFVNEDIKNKIISESKALVLPSKEEGFGIVIMEALAFNTPVVCYDLPALRAIFSKYKAVYFVRSFQKVQFANKIIEVVSNPTKKIKEGVATWDDVYRIQSGYF
jgi:glycosyltransferase involved in cell wall biosynthesis